MASPIPLQMGDKVISVVNAVLATTIYLPIPTSGRVKDFQVALGAALTTADETWTLAYAPPSSTTYTNITGGAVTIATASSAAGNVGRVAINAANGYVTDGGTLRITPSGGGGGAVPLGISIVIGA